YHLVDFGPPGRHSKDLAIRRDGQSPDTASDVASALDGGPGVEANDCKAPEFPSDDRNGPVWRECEAVGVAHVYRHLNGFVLAGIVEVEELRRAFFTRNRDGSAVRDTRERFEVIDRLLLLADGLTGRSAEQHHQEGQDNNASQRRTNSHASHRPTLPDAVR